ncbi:LPS assembly protein LptD [Sphingomonas naphthae]|uniref:LPS-assembly protein LptD n=1 Tax=Sphingomonas naphthae TaxID=1813468 RepID=A0ABY7TR04_9SPHN|nr:LPS assembly protein LptD [Sphingomonas naphthae]WCT75426.1 LPS assembly protein LptD [Sphingomonas naphthae]
MADPAFAQAPAAPALGEARPNLQTPAIALPETSGAPTPANDEEVTFSSATLDYASDDDIVTATGDVRMVRAGSRLRADKVVWNRKTGQVTANGNVAVVNPGGDKLYGDSIELTDTLKDGVIANLLLVLDDGGRLAARKGTRANGVSTLQNAAYTACRVVDSDGCPKVPVWQITALRVVHDPTKHRVSYKDARFVLFGMPILWLPTFSHPDGSGQQGNSGLLVPNLSYNRTNGLEVALPYYYKFGPNGDLTVTPHVYTAVLPALEFKYRRLTSIGAYQISGIGTQSSKLPIGAPATQDSDKAFRGYLNANGRFQFGPNWTVTAVGRVTTDRTFLRRYDITGEDRLRSTVQVERVDADSYLRIAGWAVQTLRAVGSQGQQPFALPAIDYRRRIDETLLGGHIDLQGNSLALIRTEGQDTQRAFAAAMWTRDMLTGMGQMVSFTGYARGDVYHTSDTLSTATVAYRGDKGWTTRGIAAAAADVRWPFIGTLFGGTQRITPRFQLVATPGTPNLRIPNEDARAVDLEDSNLFALNRFNGYDRWEDSSRATYGFEWNYDRPGVAIRGVIGQSYRLQARQDILSQGTGLSDRWSDYVGRVSVRYGTFLELTERFRLDKNGLKVRRNEIDATIGSRATYFTAGYLRLNRNILSSIEDLRDHEEIRVGARVKVARFWSIFGSTVVDLTGRNDDPVANTDGFEPFRHRLGILYSDDCLDLGITWKRDYFRTGDARGGNAFLLKLAFKNIGR